MEYTDVEVKSTDGGTTYIKDGTATPKQDAEVFEVTGTATHHSLEEGKTYNLSNTAGQINVNGIYEGGKSPYKFLAQG